MARAYRDVEEKASDNAANRRAAHLGNPTEQSLREYEDALRDKSNLLAYCEANLVGRVKDEIDRNFRFSRADRAALRGAEAQLQLPAFTEALRGLM